MTRTLPLGLVAVIACAPASTVSPDSEPEVASGSAGLSVEYRGLASLQGHFARPGQAESLSIRWILHCDADARCVSDLGAAPPGESVSELERTMTVHDASWRGPVGLGDEEHAAMRRLVALVGPNSWRSPTPNRELRFAHHRLGDTVDAAAYGERRLFDGRALAQTVALSHHGSEAQWTATLELHDVAAAPLPAFVPAEPRATPEPHMEALRDGLWRIDFPAVDARCVIVESADRLVVLEAPWSSAVGEAVVDLAAERFPDKPIATVAFSHHHPHYTGGLRAMMAAGAKILAPPGNAAFARSIGARAFTLQPDRWAEASGDRVPEVRVFEGETAIDGDHPVVAIDIGAASEHTDEYVVFWIPSMGVLVQADLGWYALDSGTLRASGRAAGLLSAVEARALPVEEIVQIWPLGTTPGRLPFARFRALVRDAR